MTNDLRERVARAIYECDPMLRRSPGGGLEKVPWDELSQWDQSVAFATADAAISAMGLPTREQVEGAIEAIVDYWEPVYLAERTAPIAGCGLPRDWDNRLTGFEAARQRLLDLIPMTEVNDER